MSAATMSPEQIALLDVERVRMPQMVFASENAGYFVEPGDELAGLLIRHDQHFGAQSMNRDRDIGVAWVLTKPGLVVKVPLPSNQIATEIDNGMAWFRALYPLAFPVVRIRFKEKVGKPGSQWKRFEIVWGAPSDPREVSKLLGAIPADIPPPPNPADYVGTEQEPWGE